MRGKLARGATGFPGIKSSPNVLRPRDPFAYLTLQPGKAAADRTAQGIDKSKNFFVQHGHVKTTRAKSVVRKFVRDPYNKLSTTGIRATGATVATFAAETAHLTSNPNPMYDPSQSSGAVVETSARDLVMEKPGKAGRGHQRVVKRTLFNQNQGKRLKRV